MDSLKKVATAVVLCAGFAVPALAEPPSHLMYLNTVGRVASMDIIDQEHIKTLLQEAKPLPAGTLIFVNGDMLYIATDKMLPDGKMLSDEVMH
jgi:hypothetical protein